MVKSINTILIIQTAFTGDVVLATALCEKINTHYPNCRIELLVRKGNEKLFVDHPYLHKVHIWDKNQKYSSLYSIYRKLKRKRWDAIINLQRFGSSGLLTWLLRSSMKIGFKKNPFSFCYSFKVSHSYEKGLHEVDRNAQLLAPLQIDSTDSRPQLYPSKQHIGTAKKLIQKPFITVSPASVWATKKLPLDKWVHLCNQQHSSLHIFILGAPGDKELGNDLIAKASHPNIVNLCGKSNLLTSAAIMKEAKMNYVNDSGPTHLASSVNAPVTTFYCSTVPKFGFGPLSDSSTIIETREDLSCRPCGIHGHKACPEGHFKCGHTIQVPQPVAFDQ